MREVGVYVRRVERNRRVRKINSEAMSPINYLQQVVLLTVKDEFAF